AAVLNGLAAGGAIAGVRETVARAGYSDAGDGSAVGPSSRGGYASARMGIGMRACVGRATGALVSPALAAAVVDDDGATGSHRDLCRSAGGQHQDELTRDSH